MLIRDLDLGGVISLEWIRVACVAYQLNRLPAPCRSLFQNHSGGIYIYILYSKYNE